MINKNEEKKKIDITWPPKEDVEKEKEKTFEEVLEETQKKEEGKPSS